MMKLIVLSFLFFALQITLSLDAIMLTVGKDAAMFERSINSAMKNLVDVNVFYIISPNGVELRKNLRSNLQSDRIRYVDEASFPFTMKNVTEVMIESVRDAGVYPLSGNSEFEKALPSRAGWFFQQLLKFYASLVLPNIQDYAILDGDIVWHKTVNFVNHSAPQPNYFYVSSSQYHPDYFSTFTSLTGLPRYESNGVHRSGIVHHMVIVKSVLTSLISHIEEYHKNQTKIFRPFWQVMIRISALQLTCRAPKQKVCGQGSTLSEYELYFHYARHKFPHTLTLRPLAWANGPRPGLLYWPTTSASTSTNPISFNQGARNHWITYKQAGGKKNKFLAISFFILNMRLYS